MILWWFLYHNQQQKPRFPSSCIIWVVIPISYSSSYSFKQIPLCLPPPSQKKKKSLNYTPWKISSSPKFKFNALLNFLNVWVKGFPRSTWKSFRHFLKLLFLFLCFVILDLLNRLCQIFVVFVCVWGVGGCVYVYEYWLSIWEEAESPRRHDFVLPLQDFLD